jgi:hypothetical protein
MRRDQEKLSPGFRHRSLSGTSVEERPGFYIESECFCHPSNTPPTFLLHAEDDPRDDVRIRGLLQCSEEGRRFRGDAFVMHRADTHSGAAHQLSDYG